MQKADDGRDQLRVLHSEVAPLRASGVRASRLERSFSTGPRRPPLSKEIAWPEAVGPCRCVPASMLIAGPADMIASRCISTYAFPHANFTTLVHRISLCIDDTLGLPLVQPCELMLRLFLAHPPLQNINHIWDFHTAETQIQKTDVKAEFQS